ncbi:MAG: MBOAT family protein [Bacteroidia bacterium]|nr:MBOAT family protein [Bacteroidia bacterium]
MLFNSFEFAYFLPIVFALYWSFFRRNLNLQNALLVVVSYFFYGWWDWRFLSLLAISSFADFFIGKAMHYSDDEKRRKLLLGISLAINLGVLGFFKYFNFFVDSFIDMFQVFGVELNARTLNIILPVGISFYTFQTLSYTIDIYRKNLKPTENLITFFAFVSFFPQLVAGPIERATHLIPQFERERKFDFELAIDGSRQILWGFFKKIVIADSCAPIVDEIFNNYQTMDTGMLILGAIYFSFQIYGDFSGYSDIAIGTARLFGFDLMQNFNLPYFSRDIGEFWRRWHISLSTWFRDYLYIPLGGSRGGKWMRLRNVIIIFTVSGFWHGANWTFVVWGFLNGLYYIPLMLLGLQFGNKGSVVAQGKLLPNFKEILMIGSTYFMTIIAWIFFRAKDVGEAFGYIGRLFTNWHFSMPSGKLEVMFFIIIMLIFEWLQREEPHGFRLKSVPLVARWVIYGITTIAIFKYFSLDKSFIYFAF